MQSAIAFDPASIPWRAPASDGTSFALLDGDPTRNDTFSYAFFIPAGFWDAPHFHATTSRLVVGSGVLRLNYGQILNKTETPAYGAGSFLRVPGGAVHYDGAEEDTVIIGVASGPWSTTYS